MIGWTGGGSDERNASAEAAGGVNLRQDGAAGPTTGYLRETGRDENAARLVQGRRARRWVAAHCLLGPRSLLVVFQDLITNYSWVTEVFLSKYFLY